MPKIWKPQLFKRQFYSEILDAKLTITVTMRTLDLIDQAYGFDFYILKARPRRGPDCPRCPWTESCPCRALGAAEGLLSCVSIVGACTHTASAACSDTPACFVAPAPCVSV